MNIVHFKQHLFIHIKGAAVGSSSSIVVVVKCEHVSHISYNVVKGTLGVHELFIKSCNSVPEANSTSHELVHTILVGFLHPMKNVAAFINRHTF